MKNKEKYIDEMVEALSEVNGPCKFRNKFVVKGQNCAFQDCIKCRRETRNWLEAEYIEPIRLTRNEKAILESLPKEIKWIARDKHDLDLFVYSNKPYREEKNRYWRASLGSCRMLSIFNHLFQFIKWEDEEPQSIEELLKCGVVDDE